jgi:hypothetical protein
MSILATLRISTTMMFDPLFYLGVAQNPLLADTIMLAIIRTGSVQVPGQYARMKFLLDTGASVTRLFWRRFVKSLFRVYYQMT